MGLGQLLLVGAVICEAAYSVIGKAHGGARPQAHHLADQPVGFAPSTPLGLYMAWGFDFAAVSWNIWLLLVFYALAACMCTVWLWMTGLGIVPTAQGGIFTVLLPISRTGGGAGAGRVVLGPAIAGIWHCAGQRPAGHLAHACGTARGSKGQFKPAVDPALITIPSASA